MDEKDTAYLEWLESDFSEFDKIPARERLKNIMFEVVCGVGMCGLLCLLGLVIAWIHNTGVALR